MAPRECSELWVNVLYFHSLPLAANIDGNGVCSPASSSSPLTATPVPLTDLLQLIARD